MVINNPQLLTARIINFVRSGAAASGNVSYTGAGFRPRAIVMGFGHPGSQSISFGAAGDNAVDYDISLNPTGVTASSSLGELYTDSNFNAGQSAQLVSLDADGFTLAWTKVGAGLGAGDLYGWALCLA